MDEESKYEMVRVTWEDACFGKDEPPAPMMLQSLGYLYSQDDRHIVIAMENRVADDECRDFLTLPMAYVKVIEYLCPRAEIPSDYSFPQSTSITTTATIRDYRPTVQYDTR